MRRTYSTLISNHKGRSRLQQVIDWVGGPDFSGVLCFDECHKAKNFVPGKESQSTKVIPPPPFPFLFFLLSSSPWFVSRLPHSPASLQVATAVLELQRLLPRSRVVYCRLASTLTLHDPIAIYTTIYHASCSTEELVAAICRHLRLSQNWPHWAAFQVLSGADLDACVRRRLVQCDRSERGEQHGLHGAAGPVGPGVGLPQL